MLSSLSPDLSADALQRQFALQQALSQSPLVTGNTATILRDGAEALPAMFAAMQAARDHINLEYFIFADVVCSGTALSDVLTDRLRARGRRSTSSTMPMAPADTPPRCSKRCVPPARVVMYQSARSVRAPRWAGHRTIAIIARYW